eukprot:scaffold8103_cov85-Cylindrotheca_fusiformis.AAC.2
MSRLSEGDVGVIPSPTKKPCLNLLKHPFSSNSELEWLYHCCKQWMDECEIIIASLIASLVSDFFNDDDGHQQGIHASQST